MQKKNWYVITKKIRNYINIKINLNSKNKIKYKIKYKKKNVFNC